MEFEQVPSTQLCSTIDRRPPRINIYQSGTSRETAPNPRCVQISLFTFFQLIFLCVVAGNHFFVPFSSCLCVCVCVLLLLFECVFCCLSPMNYGARERERVSSALGLCFDDLWHLYTSTLSDIGLMFALCHICCTCFVFLSVVSFSFG